MRLKVVSLRRNRVNKATLMLIIVCFLLVFFIFQGYKIKEVLFSQIENKKILEKGSIPEYWLYLIMKQELFAFEEKEKATSIVSEADKIWEKYLYARKDPRAVILLELGWLSGLGRIDWEFLLTANTELYAAPVSTVAENIKSSVGKQNEESNMKSTEGSFETGLEPGGIETIYNNALDDTIKVNSTLNLERKNPLVAIYNTHNSETYIPTDGRSKIEGENGGVAKVAQTLHDILEERYGIPTIYVDTIHDYPDWSKSYANSAQTVKKILQQYPDLKLLVDIHRDALPIDNADYVNINGEKTARVLIIVGSDQRMAHPHWQKNLLLAENIERILSSRYPGFCKGVRIKPGTYNQHLHPGAILVEVGNDCNSLEEAKRAAVLLAEAFYEVVAK